MKEVRGLKNVNRKFIQKLEEQRGEIERLKDELRRVKEEASIDPLTGLRNRRSFERALREFFRDFKRFGYPFSADTC
ncbi:MAG: GGDEF domain-containing protein [Aquificota bacterium]|nr:GGDEF domain-containing protein [Aquificota bacterium]